MSRVLLDQNVPYAVTALLLGAGVEAAHARDMGLARSPDAVILGVAADGGWIIVTHDKALDPTVGAS